MAHSNTRDRLITAAERLFADYGIEAVSPRQIAIAAGQRNPSAIRYHFGSKEAVVEAVLARGMADINSRRRAMLDEMQRRGGMNDLRRLLSAVAVPLAEKIEQTAKGDDYVRFLANFVADRRRRDVLIARGPEAGLLQHIFRSMRALVPELPESLWMERLRFVARGIVYALADRERLRATGDATFGRLNKSVFMGNLIDVGVAALTAPASAATLTDMALESTLAKENGNGTDTRARRAGPQRQSGPSDSPRRDNWSGTSWS